MTNRNRSGKLAQRREEACPEACGHFLKYHDSHGCTGHVYESVAAWSPDEIVACPCKRSGGKKDGGSK